MQKLIFFFQSASAGGIMLISASILGVILANSTFSNMYFALLNYTVGGLSILLWINDALMAIFFLLVGLELRREMVKGQLNTKAKRLLPGLGAACGFMVPALIYLSFNYSHPHYMHGWAVPTATDIAFSLALITLFKSKVPVSLKVFLTALAVVDDLMAIIVIAIFYSSSLAWTYIIGALLMLGVLAFLARKQVPQPLPYIIIGLLLWFCVFKSGLHATLAGVLLAFMIPFKLKRVRYYFPLAKWEHTLKNWVALLIVPLFGFANAGVAFGSFELSYLFHPIVLGVAVGLFLGKQIGIFGLVYGLVKSNIVPMPAGATWRHVYGIAVVCGIGFTMSLFIGMLAFQTPQELDLAKIGVFMGSIASAIMGSLILYSCPRWKH